MTLGWYVHHHGGGHLTRFAAVRPHIPDSVICFSTLPEPASMPADTEWVQLEPDDELTDPQQPTAGGLLHWAPLGHAPHARRLALIASVTAARGISTMVVDVSAEVTLLARLLGHRTVVFTQPGIRDDRPHSLAFEAAHRIIAPWPAGVLAAPHLDAVREKVHFVGGISRFDARPRPAAGRSGVLVLGGAGGAVVSSGMIAAAAASSELPWSMLGAPAQPDLAAQPWVADPWPAITSAEVVVAWAGQNSIADLAAAGARAVIVPQPRPFEEQVHTARALADAGLVVMEPSWPSPERWPDVLTRAAALHPDWSRWQTAGAAQRAAAIITETLAA